MLAQELINVVAAPHPFPYQGSKRGIAKYILPHFPSDIDCLIEPFCGAGAISIAAATAKVANRFLLNDINAPLMLLWEEILHRPEKLAKSYEKLWVAQQEDKKAFFFHVRDRFNVSHQPHDLLYLLARIVKGSVRYNAKGDFNQSPDNRRAGMHPDKMRQQLFGVFSLLAKKTVLSAVDFRGLVAAAQKKDLVYMDPPYQGTSFTRDHRYYGGLSYDEFVSVLCMMNNGNLSYVISYDGETGGKKHGKHLPESLNLTRLSIHAGRSSQATLLGNDHCTVESLYLSPALAARLKNEHRSSVVQQPELSFA